MYPKTISNEDVNKLELKAYEGHIELVENYADLKKALNKIKKHSVVGFDTETKPNFTKGNKNDVSLIQIALPDIVYLVRIKDMGIPEILMQFLESGDILKIGVALQDDLKDLQRIVDFNPEGFLELNKLVTPIGIESNGLRKLTAIILGFRISKSAQTSNWENERLTAKQQQYAATDAWVCLTMYDDLVRKGYL